MLPETRYAPLNGAHIAYQIVGEGPPDLVVTAGSFSHTDVVWEDPGAALFYRRLATFCRVIRFDRLGTGNSDPLPAGALPPLERYVEELEAVLDHAGSERTALMAMLDAGPMALLFAATKPERTEALILYNTAAKLVASDDYPIGPPREDVDATLAMIEQTWGTDAVIPLNVPSRADDERFRRWYAKFVRAIASPSAVHAFFQALFEADARPLLGSIRSPTLVMHRSGYQIVTIDHGRYLAEHIPGARFIELPGADGPVFWETPDLILEELHRFLVGIPQGGDTGRVLATVLFTDIVGSTERARELGDRQWREFLEVHDDVCRRVIDGVGGRVVKTTGDGVLAVFEGPGRAIRCASQLRDELRGIGLEIRVGLHTGEIELRSDDDVGGIAVHIAARIMGEAGAGEILVSRTLRDLVVGSDVPLEDRGTHELKGIVGGWQLFAVAV